MVVEQKIHRPIQAVHWDTNLAIGLTIMMQLVRRTELKQEAVTEVVVTKPKLKTKLELR